MNDNFQFESTQCRGRRIQEAISDLAWDEMPEDRLTLKEYAPPSMKKDDIPTQKPNIKKTLREFWELKEDADEEEKNDLSPAPQQIQEMEIEKVEEKNENENKTYAIDAKEDYTNEEILYKKKPSKPLPSTSEKKVISINVIAPEERAIMRSQANLGSQSTQSMDYMKKLAKAFDENKMGKGKTKYSQKFGTTSSFYPKKKRSEMTQMTSAEGIHEEDIEDLDETSGGGVYVANLGHKKIKLETEENPIKSHVLSTVSKYYDYFKKGRSSTAFSSTFNTPYVYKN